MRGSGMGSRCRDERRESFNIIFSPFSPFIPIHFTSSILPSTSFLYTMSVCHRPLPTKTHFLPPSTSNSFPNPPQNPTIYAPSAEARIRQQGGARAHLNSPLLVCPARGASSPTRRLQSSFGCPSTDCTARFWPRRLPARRIDSSILTPGLPASEACPLALARRHASAPPPSPCLAASAPPALSLCAPLCSANKPCAYRRLLTLCPLHLSQARIKPTRQNKDDDDCG